MTSGESADLPALLPSRQIDLLRQAIGRRLEGIDRLILRDEAAFLEDGRFSAPEYFTRSTGPTQFRFEGGVRHTFDVWPSQLSIILVPEGLSEHPYARLVRLEDTAAAPPALKRCLGQTCRDVRIWTLREDLDSGEAKETAISYVLGGAVAAGGSKAGQEHEDGQEGVQELFYGIYLHGDLDADYLLLGEEVPRDRVARCFSVAEGRTVEPS